MSLSETRQFLEDLFSRFELDTAAGSRVQTELIEPILTRIGIDPFDEDIAVFIRERVRQAHPELAITAADELTDLLIDPMRVLVEPLVREVKLVKLRMSLRNLSSLADDEVDALMGNFFEARKNGGFSGGVVRVYFTTPQTVSVTATNIGLAKAGLRYQPTRAQQITADQMLLNMEGTEYYVDFNYTAESRGTEYDIEAGEIVSVAGLPTATRVRNPRRFRGGSPRETNEEYAARTQQGTSDKTLATEPGILAVLQGAFPDLRQLFSIGMGDPEMQRDLLKGGSLGSIPAADTLGTYFGAGAPVDDLDADTTSSLLEAPTGNFISRLGAAGTTPDNWFATLTYYNGMTLVVEDAAVTQVLSNTVIRTAHELPLGLPPGSVIWALRKRVLTISDIPGGIVFPSSATGELEVSSDGVHIGGKTDIYVAGAFEDASAQITSISDEAPVAQGFNAQTQASVSGQEDVVLLTDLPGGLEPLLRTGMSLVLNEGADAGSYRIVELLVAPARVRVNVPLTGTQANLSWRIVDEIDMSLVRPRDILAEGSDLLLSAGSPTVGTTGGLNFTDAGVLAGDILFVDDALGGGEFTIEEVSAVTLRIDPSAPRTLAGVHYLIYRQSAGILAPVLRVKSLELLDSTGAPNGVQIPYRDPVLVTSNAFQNEGAGYAYDGPALAGLITANGDTFLATGLSFTWSTYEPARRYLGPSATGTFTFTGVTTWPAAVAAINGNGALTAAGVRASAIEHAGQTYLGIACRQCLVLDSGPALAALGWFGGISNCHIRPSPSGRSFALLKFRRGDLVEFTTGNNTGAGGRLLVDPTALADMSILGDGPLGPPGTTALYNNVPLNPDPAGRIRVARPSVGSARVYFLAPTSAEFRYATTRLRTEAQGQALVYRPDPEVTRTVLPPPPRTALPDTATTNGGTGQLTDAATDFLLQGIVPGDLVDVLYVPIRGTSDLPSSGTVAVGGLTLGIGLAENSEILVAFPYAMTREDIVTYINAQLGEVVAQLTVTGALELRSAKRITLNATSTSLSVLFLATLDSTHPGAGTYIVGTVARHVLSFTATPALPAGTVEDAHYQVRRYVQRISSTEMSSQLDASGLYYATVEAVATLPGDRHNISNGVEMEITGHASDGYRLSTDRETTSYSRAEDVKAQLSRSIVLVGSADSPEEYVQLSGQSLQVAYERSSLVDEVQSFCDSAYRRILLGEILVRHLLPHYVSLRWTYAGGAAEPEMTRAIVEYLDTVPGGGELEVGHLTDLLRRRQARSVYTPDAESPQGRAAPLLLVVRHNADRTVRASLVRDLVSTVRVQRYIADAIELRRVPDRAILR